MQVGKYYVIDVSIGGAGGSKIYGKLDNIQIINNVIPETIYIFVDCIVRNTFGTFRVTEPIQIISHYLRMSAQVEPMDKPILYLLFQHIPNELHASIVEPLVSAVQSEERVNVPEDLIEMTQSNAVNIYGDPVNENYGEQDGNDSDHEGAKRRRKTHKKKTRNH